MNQKLQEWVEKLPSIREGSPWFATPLVVIILVMLLLGMYWSSEPDPFDVVEAAILHAPETDARLTTGSYTTSAAITVMETLLNKPGGYLSNDILPPSVFMDNIPNWEFGALVQIRDVTRAMRNDFSRSQSQSVEDKDLIIAEPQFNFDSTSWILPSTEGEYKEGVKALYGYLERLQDPSTPDAQFYARADNMVAWLTQVETRLGSLSQRLSASVGQVRFNTDLAGESDAVQSTVTSQQLMVKTPWSEIDDVFYEARGASWALMHLLKAAEIDFEPILTRKNALISLRQIIRELEATQETLWSPVILNGSGFGVFANHSLVMASYLSRANAAVIDLRNLMQQG